MRGTQDTFEESYPSYIRSCPFIAVIIKPMRSLATRIRPSCRFSTFKASQKTLLGGSAANELSHLAPQKFAQKPRDINFTKLPSGIRVISESTILPSTVQLGVYLDVGTRDQSAENSGALHSIHNTYLKTVLNTNETINYGVHQMSGGDFEMFYDREYAFFRGSCLAHDTVDVFRMMIDCALEPRSAVAANVGMDKNIHSHKLSEILGGNDGYNDAIHAAAFGAKGLGNPLKGTKSNIANLTYNVLQNFQLENFSADRLIILGAGIDSHNEFLELVNDKLSEIQLSSFPKNTREEGKYLGGEVRNLNDSKTTNVTIAFEGQTFKKGLPLLIAKTILADTKSESGTLYRNVLHNNAYIDTVESFSQGYTDTGLFGVKLSGSSGHVKNVFGNAVKSLQNLRDIKQKDFELGRNALRRYLNEYWQFPRYRLEYFAKDFTHQNDTRRSYDQELMKITFDDVHSAITTALKSRPTIVVQGSNTFEVSTYDQVSNAFN